MAQRMPARYPAGGAPATDLLSVDDPALSVIGNTTKEGPAEPRERRSPSRERRARTPEFIAHRHRSDIQIDANAN
jgi:hypothetical protein